MERKTVTPNTGGSGRHSNGERGQVLVLALLAMALGVILIAGFLYYVSTSQRATKAVREVTLDQYSADSGAEHAIWRLTSEPGFSDSLAGGNPESYTLTINGRTVTITVTKVLDP
jgi:Tfp pilus assembly protein PilX